MEKFVVIRSAPKNQLGVQSFLVEDGELNKMLDTGDIQENDMVYELSGLKWQAIKSKPLQLISL